MTAITLPIRRLAIAMTAAAALSACTGAPQAAASSTLVRADSLLRGYTAMPAARQAAVADSLRPAIDAMAAVGIMDGTSSRDISNYVEGRAFAFFEDGVEEQFTCGDSISGVLDSIRAGLAAQFPDVEWPKVYGIVSPYRQAIVNADSVSLIALNHYLGSDYEAYSGFEPYVRRQKSPQLLPYQFTEALLMRDYPQPVDSVGSRPSDVLAVMAHDGAVACAMLRVIPSASIAEVGGWTDSELAWLQAHEQDLLAELAADGKLHSTDPLLKARLVEPAPASLAFRLHAPGRAGRYLGLRMVERYLAAHPGVTPACILANPALLDKLY